MIEKKALTSVPVNDLIASRWSGRAFNPDKPVPHEDLQALMEAARWAPSCYGDEPWRFVICDRFSNKTAWWQAFDCLAEGNQGWAKNAPVLILACANSLLSKNSRPNRWAQYDTGAASMSICIEATYQGLMVHQMGGYDAGKAESVFNVPEQFSSMAMIAVGYQLAEESLPDDLRARELAPRQRSGLAEMFFDGAWDKAYPFK